VPDGHSPISNRHGPGRALCAAALACGALWLGPAQAGPLGIVADNGTGTLSIFNADHDRVTGTLAARPGLAVGDCALASDESLGFVTGGNHEITLLRLDSGDGRAAARATQVPISNLGVDMALYPDDSLLVLAGGGSLAQPLSVVDTATGAEIATAGPFVDHTSVEFCDNGTLLVTTTNGAYLGGQPDNALYDARLDPQGRVSLKGHRISSGAQPNNAVCAPGSLAGALLDRDGGLTSFTMPGLTPADHAVVDGSALVAAVFARDGRVLYARSRYAVAAFGFDPLSGEMTPGWRRELPRSSTFYGVEQIALHPAGDKLYVDGGGPLLILDPASGNELGGLDLTDATGVCFANTAARPAGILLGQVP